MNETSYDDVGEALYSMIHTICSYLDITCSRITCGYIYVTRFFKSHVYNIWGITLCSYIWELYSLQIFLFFYNLKKLKSHNKSCDSR